MSTVLAAAALGVPVLMDDGWGKRLAVARGVPVFTTEDLAVEMAATDHTRPVFAFGIYRVVYRESTRAEFDRRVAELRAGLGR